MVCAKTLQGCDQQGCDKIVTNLSNKVVTTLYNHDFLYRKD